MLTIFLYIFLDVAAKWTTVTLPENKMSWSAKIQLDRATAKDMMFRNSEWGPEANKAMIKEVYNFPVKQGGVLGDLIDATDKDMISRVYIEEKLFRTWTHGRTALIGDGMFFLDADMGFFVLVNLRSLRRTDRANCILLFLF